MGLPNRAHEDRALKCFTGDPDEGMSPISWIESHPVTTVRIDALALADSPRLGGEDPEHIRLLADAGATLPPITVHRATMRVIDGIHRVRAAMLNGATEIRARVLDCDDNTAFVLAVQANIAHGLPLSQPDRVAAAVRIIAAQPQWSDRAVAAATGLSDKTVSKVRNRSTAGAPQSNTRLGKDGRVRPLDSGPQRLQAAMMINDRPDAGLREVARATGLSPATVRDVRARIDRGEDPVPDKYRVAGIREKRDFAPVSPRPRPLRASGGGHTWRREVYADRNMLLAKLRHDPSLKFNEAGRNALRWLHHHTVDTGSLENLGRGLPDHWAPIVAGLARSCATAWTQLAEQLEQRAQ